MSDIYFTSSSVFPSPHYLSHHKPINQPINQTDQAIKQTKIAILLLFSLCCLSHCVCICQPTTSVFPSGTFTTPPSVPPQASITCNMEDSRGGSRGFPGGGVPCRVLVRVSYRVPVRVIGGIPGWVQVGFQRWGGGSIQGFREGSKGDSREGSRVG